MSDYSTTRLQDHKTGDGLAARRGQWSMASGRRSSSESAFTLAELVVSVGVLALLVFLATQLINSAATVTVLGYKKMDAESEARQVFDRMTFDFQQMLKRTDVDYFLKSSSGPGNGDCLACRPQVGNDQAAFYSAVAGYYPTPTAIPTGTPIGASPVSLVSYRVNSDSGPPPSSSYNMMERMGKALAWNGVFPGFIPNSSLMPVVSLPQTIGGNWPAACYPLCSSDPSYKTDSAYETIGPQVFRFEYCYLLKNGTFSDIPWDTTSSVGHSKVNGMQDIAAIVVDIGVIDPRSKVLVTDCQLAQLNGAALPAGCPTPAQYPVLIDWGNTSCDGCPEQTQWQQTPGLLQAQWRAAIDANAAPNGIGLPPPVISGIRVYERYFYLTH